MVGLFNTDGVISFSEEDHLYTSTRDNSRYESVTRVINTLQVPFDRDGISMRMAKGDPQKQQEILDKWEKAKNSSVDRGNRIHLAFENYVLKGDRDEDLMLCYPVLQEILSSGVKYYPEALVYNPSYRIAGQSDLVVQRQNTKKSLFDFYDYKTNESKGIEFDSVYKKGGNVTHYNKFFLPPLDFMEDCNFNRYAIQLSTYAYLAQATWGIRVGKLAILFVDPDNTIINIPVSYMKLEVVAMLESFAAMKSLPVPGKNSKYSM